MIRVLVTGENSYIGNSFSNYINSKCNIDVKDSICITKVYMINVDVDLFDLSKYDVVFHVAGIAHSDNGIINEEKKKLYYSINTDLTLRLAKKAIETGVKHFIYMSSIIVYGDSSNIGEKKNITKDTIPSPINAYGDSKLKAEEGLINLYNDIQNAKLSIIRAPMVYGENCKGNYMTLCKFAKMSPVFPFIYNERSVIYIDSLCEFVYGLCKTTDFTRFIHFPQDTKYMTTSLAVKDIAKKNGKNIILLYGFDELFKRLSKKIHLINKVFGNLTYDKNLVRIKI